MLHLARFAITRPKVSLAACIVLIGALVAIGAGIKDSLSPTVVVVPGTESSRAQTLAEDEFGPSVLVPILLQGPAAQLDVQGPKLVRDLSARPDTRVMSAWSTGDVGKELRPRTTAAMIVASVARSEKDMVRKHQEQIEDLVDADVSGPVTAAITGQPSIDRAARDESLDTTRTAELLAIPVIFVVAFFLLRSLLAAVIVSAVGVATVYASFGVMTLVGKVLDVDAAAMATGTLTGLALAVGYSIVLLRRFREEETAATDHVAAAHAASAAVQTTGRAVLIGGSAIIIALLLALVLSSIKVQASVGVGVLTCATLAIGAAVVTLPALLSLFGHRLDPFTPPGFEPAAKGWNRLVGAGDTIVRRPALALALGVIGLGALAIPVLSVDTGPPDIAQLPESSQARQDFETVSDVMGPGWATPYNVLVVSNKEPLTSVNLLPAVGRLQEQFSRDRGVASVIGPGAFRPTAADLSGFPNQLGESAKVAAESKKSLKRLQDGLDQAGAGAAELRGGLSDAAAGAGRLGGGSGQAETGAGKLEAGLAAARGGAAKISGGLKSALAGASALRAGAAKALAGSRQLQGGLGEANTPLKAGVPIAKQMAANANTTSQAVATGKTQAAATSSQIAAALANLRGLESAKGDPGYQATVNALTAAQSSAQELAGALERAAGPASAASAVAAGFSDQVAKLADGVGRLLAGSTDLAGGIAQLEKGNSDLAGGLKRLSAGGGDLTDGLDALRNGAGQLEDGLGQLTAGAGQLSGGLTSGVGPTGELVTGLGTMEAAVAKARGSVPSTKDLERLQKESPGLFDSGYFVLAALEGATPGNRDVAGFAVNLDRGGNAGQIVVIPAKPASDQATQDLGATLRDQADAFGKATGTELAVGGPAGNLTDFRGLAESRLLLTILAIAGAIALLMMVALRAVALPIAATVLNGLGVAAAFGVLTLLSTGDDPVLGGPGYLDSMALIGMFAMVFGLSAMYEMFLLLRTRELFVQSGDARSSMRTALRSTAFAATGAALVMLAAAIPFAVTDFVPVAQFGVGVAAAVAIDAFLVRPVLLPAAVSLLGKRAWWPTTGPVHEAGPGETPRSGEPVAEEPTRKSGRFARRPRTEVPTEGPTAPTVQT